MADQDKDKMNPITGQTTGAGTSNSNPSSNTQQRTGAAGASSGISGGSTASSQAGSTSTTGDAARRTMDEAKEYTKDMAGRAKEQGRSMFDEQKDSAARQVDSAAHAFRNTAEQLQGEGQSQASRYVGMFAEQLESFGGQLRHKNMDSLIRDAEDLARRSPGVFLAGSVVAGFVLARFLKSSAEHRHGQNEMSRSDWDSDFARGSDRSGSVSGAYEPARSTSGSTASTGQSSVSSSAGNTGTSAGSGGFSGAGNAGAVGSAGSAASGTTGTTGSTTGTTGSATPSIGADGTGAGDKVTPPSTSTTSKPGGNTYGNR